jgi:hypothetical protein
VIGGHTPLDVREELYLLQLPGMIAKKGVLMPPNQLFSPEWEIAA